MAAISVTRPRADSTKPAEIAARQSIVTALQALGAPVGPGEDCSPRYELVIGVGQKAIPLETKAVFLPDRTDSDLLQLTCTP